MRLGVVFPQTEIILRGVAAGPPLVELGIGAQDMVIRNQVGIAQVFRRLDTVAYCDWINPRTTTSTSGFALSTTPRT